MQVPTDPTNLQVVHLTSIVEHNMHAVPFQYSLEVHSLHLKVPDLVVSQKN